MEYSFKQIERLERILEAELTGAAIDRDEGRRLAEQLADLCPAIAPSMRVAANRWRGSPGGCLR